MQPHRAYIDWLNLGFNGDSIFFGIGELYLKAQTTAIYMYNGTNITQAQAFGGSVSQEGHLIKFLYHGTA